MKKAIIIGASSGIGRALTELLIKKGYTIGITARRLDLLKELKNKYPKHIIYEAFDVSDQEATIKGLENMIKELGNVQLIVNCAGIGFDNEQLDLEKEQAVLGVNVAGFTTITNQALQYFTKKKSGQLVTITSIAGLLTIADCPSYSASKAFEINYLESMRKFLKKKKLPITITDIRPGFVDTRMAKGENLFRVASPQKAAEQIFTAIKKKKTVAYVTKRRIILAWIIKLFPKRLIDLFLG